MMLNSSKSRVLIALFAAVGCADRTSDDEVTSDELVDATASDTTSESGTTGSGTTESGTTESGTTESGTTESGTSESGTTETTESGTSETTGEPLPDASYLLAIETPLSPELPFQFVFDRVNAVATPNGMIADVVIQPLAVVQGMTIASMCTGDLHVYENVVFDADGQFELDLELLMVPGEANPVTASDIEATLVLEGQNIIQDALCGTASGMLTYPLRFDLSGSTFAATPLPAGCNTPEFLTPAYSCSML